MFNLRSLDLNLLTVFEAIYEVGTVSGAADRLALSQSAASHGLARLRDACKDDLFVRAGPCGAQLSRGRNRTGSGSNHHEGDRSVCDHRAATHDGPLSGQPG